MKTIGLTLGLALLFSACGSSGGGVTAACKTTMTTLCDMACACTTTGATCNLGADQSATIYFDDRQDCLNWYVGLGCSQAGNAPAGFFDACLAALQTAQCRTEGDEALLIPTDCIAEED